MPNSPFVFLACLRSPASTDDYTKAETLFKLCVRAATSQIGVDARVIAVGNQ